MKKEQGTVYATIMGREFQTLKDGVEYCVIHFIYLLENGVPFAASKRIDPERHDHDTIHIGERYIIRYCGSWVKHIIWAENELIPQVLRMNSEVLQ